MTATGKLTQRVGQTLKGRYRIDQALHCGAQSTVYAGMDLKSGRAAIKVFDRLSDTSALSRSYLANAVGHPSTVNVLDSGISDDGTVFVVMELLEASSMAELLSKHEGRLPVRMACNIADQALDLLASAHAQSIVHGELELGQLFYTRAEQLKVLGFGKLVSGPEQSAAYADDVRSLSRAIAQLLTGKPVETLLVAERTSRSSQPSVFPWLPRRIATVIQKGLTNDAAQHWQSARAMRTALQLACQAELGRPVDRELRPLVKKTASKTGKQVPPRAPARMRRGVWLAAAAALVGATFVLREVVERPADADPAADVADVAERSQPVEEPQADTSAASDPAPETSTRVPEAAAASADGAEPAGIVPRKPSIPALRMPLRQKGSALPTKIAPADSLCAQLMAARRVRSLGDAEAQLWAARCEAPQGR